MPLEKTIKVLSESEINRILTTAYDINEKIGISVESKKLGDLLVKNGAGEDKGRLKLPGDLIKRCLEKSPRSFFSMTDHQTDTLLKRAVAISGPCRMP